MTFLKARSTPNARRAARRNHRHLNPSDGAQASLKLEHPQDMLDAR